MPSPHAANAAIAAANHTAHFGDPVGVAYRDNERCAWRVLTGAVVHGETTGTETRGQGATQTVARYTRRQIYIAATTGPFRVMGSIRIDGCDDVYTVRRVLQRSGRICLELEKSAVREITRPNYRPE
jgi:hypothetical protein